jgi:proliferating cell nuclear antigen
MFRATTDNTMLFKNLVGVVSSLVGEANLYCTKEGLCMQGMDASNVSMVSFSIPSTWFDEYCCTQDTVLGVSFATLEKLFKCAEKTDTTVLETKTPHEKLFVAFQSRNRITDFEVSVLDLDAELFEIPDTDYACSVSLATQTFKDLVAHLHAAGDECSVCIAKTEVRFKASGALGNLNLALKDNSTKPGVDANKMIRINVCPSFDQDFAHLGGAELEQHFLSSKLFCFSKSSFPNMTLKMSPDTPLVVEYPLGDAVKGYLRFYLAPNIGVVQSK